MQVQFSQARLGVRFGLTTAQYDEMAAKILKGESLQAGITW